MSSISKAKSIWEDAKRGDKEALARKLVGSTIAWDLQAQIAKTEESDPSGGTTALMIAAWYGHFDVVSMLIAAGVDVNCADSEGGMTALMLASKKGHMSSVQVLLDAKAGVNLKDKNGRTALMFASWNGHAASVQVLLEAGADSNVKDNERNTAANWAKTPDIKALIINYVSPDPLTLLKRKWNILSTQFTQAPPLRDTIQQRDELHREFGPIFSANTDFEAIGRIGKALKTAIAAVIQQPLSEKDYLTLRDRHAALMESVEAKCLELAEAEDYDSIMSFGAMLEELKALDLSALPDSSTVCPVATVTVTLLSNPAAARHVPALLGECDSLSTQCAQVPPLRDLIQQKGQLQVEHDLAKSTKNFIAFGRVGKALKAVTEQISQLSLSEEDYLTLKDRHASLIDKMTFECKVLAAVHDFGSLLLLAAKLKELKALDVSALPQSSSNHAPAAAPSTQKEHPDWINDPVMPPTAVPSTQEEQPDWINDPVMPPG